MKLIDFDDTTRFERLDDTTDSELMPLPGNHPVVMEVYGVIGEEHYLHLVRGTKQYRIVKTSGPGPWTELDG